MSLNIGTYECEDCGDRQLYRKQYGVDWPEVLECPFCKTNTAKKIVLSVSTHFPEGKLGNAKNNYTSTKKEFN